MFDFYIYKHSVPNSEIPFYIGKGKGRSYFRAKSKRNRNNYWYNIVNKHGYNIEITHDNICAEEANCIEKYMISFYGRKDVGSGVLCNMTDGGDGSINFKHSEESKLKISNFFKGKKCGENNPMFGKKITDEHRNKIIEAAIVSNKKRKYSEETKNKISNSLKKYYLENPDKKAFLYSEERGKKISEKLKGRVFSEEWKNKIRESKKKYKNEL